MKKKLYADGSAANDTDQTRNLVNNVARQISMRVGNTLGPGGRNYMTEEGITNDGVSILREIQFEDPRENHIAAAYEEVALRQDQDAGDGTTTATLLATTLTPLVLADVSPIEMPGLGKTVMDIKAQLESELAQALDLMDQERVEVVTVDELEKVAKTAMENHPSSRLIAETIHSIGYNSNTPLEEGFNGTISAKVVPGIHMPLKIETPAMFTNVTRKETTLEDPLILVVNHVFEAYSDLSTFFNTMIDAKKNDKSRPQPLIIIGKSFSVPFTAQVVAVSKQVGFPIVLLNANGLKDEEMMDIAEFVNARYVDTHPKTGEKASQLTFKDAGYAKKVIAGPSQTSFTGGAGIDSGRVSLRVAELQKLAETEQESLNRDLILRRAAGLQGGVATFYVDAKTAVDRYYLKKKVEDAVNSCKSALQYGTTAGGGVSLKRVADKLPADSYLGRALSVIYNRVQQNAGGNLLIDEANVRDSYWTNKCAIENAVAVVKILTTMEGVIISAEHDLVDDLARKLNLG
jgi:chaperonin GroEL